MERYNLNTNIKPVVNNRSKSTAAAMPAQHMKKWGQKAVAPVASTSKKVVSSMMGLPTREIDDISVSNRDYGYIASCQGPIILTAPHGAIFKKGNGDNESQRNHNAERYTSTIAIGLAREINNIMGHNSASFMFW